MNLEEFLAKHKDKLVITAPVDGAGTPAWGEPVPVNSRVRLLGTDEYILVELDGETWPLRMDGSFFEPPQLTTVHGIDVSSYQPLDLTHTIAFLEPRPEHVVVRMYLEEEYPPIETSIRQAASAQQAGCSVGGYVWCYDSLTPERTIHGALETAGKCGVKLPILWLDIEEYAGQPGPQEWWISLAVELCDDAEVRVGLYTAKWYWDKHHAGSVTFGHLPLWAAQYDFASPPADLSLFKPFGGWTKAAGIQWTSTPVDRNVFSSAVTV